MRNFIKWGLAFFAAALSLAAADTASAAFPDRPINLVVGFAPGGGSDLLARLLAKELSEKLGQPVVVENKPGAETVIAADIVAHAPPDGYTLLMYNIPLTIPLDFKIDIDLVKSFAPITLSMEQPTVLVVSPSLAVNSLQDFIALVKSKPGQFNFGTTGTSDTAYLGMRILVRQAGMDIVYVPFTSEAAIQTAVLGGEVQFGFLSMSSVLSMVKAGKLKPLAVSSAGRSNVLPDVPTVAEAANIPGFDSSSWYGWAAPAGTPSDIVTKLYEGFAAAVTSDELQKTLTERGFITVNLNPQQFGERIEHDIAMWADLAKTLKK